MSTEQQQQATTAATCVTKKHIRSRGRARAKRTHEQDPYASVCGNIPWEMFRTRPWLYAGKLDEATVGEYVLVFGHVQCVRPPVKTEVRKPKVIVVMRNLSRTVRCVIEASPNEGITKRMVRFAATMRRGTVIDIEGLVSLPGSDSNVYRTSQQVEIKVRKLHTMGLLKDGSQPGWESRRSSLEQEGESLKDGSRRDGASQSSSLEQEGKTLKDGSRRDGASQRSSLEQEGKTLKDGNQCDGVSQNSSTSITSRDSIMLEGNQGEPWRAGQAGRLHAIGTLKDGSRCDGASQNSSISITSRDSILLEENQVEQEGEPRRAGQAGRLHDIGTLKDGSRCDGASQNSSVSITSRDSILLEENLVEQEGEPRRAGQAGQCLAHVDRRTSLNYGCIDIYSLVHRAIFRIHSEVEYVKAFCWDPHPWRVC